MSYPIEKQIELKAPHPRVWHAVTEHLQFSEWYGALLLWPFAVGRETEGIGVYEKTAYTVRLVVEAIEPETRFAFRWHPYAVDRDFDYSKEEPTLVEFLFEPIETGTLLRVVESGFNKLPKHRRDEAFRMSLRLWDTQLQKLKVFVEAPRS